MQTATDFPADKLPKETETWLSGMVAAVASSPRPSTAVAPSVAIQRAAELGGRYYGFCESGEDEESYWFTFGGPVEARVFQSWLMETTGVPEAEIKLEGPNASPRPPGMGVFDVFAPPTVVSVRAETLDPATCAHPPALWVRQNWKGRVNPSPQPIFTTRCYCGKAGSLFLTPEALAWK